LNRVVVHENAMGEPAGELVRDLEVSATEQPGQHDTGEDVKEFMKTRGLEAWYTHLSKHLNIKTIDQLKATTAVDLRRMGIAANMKLVSSPSGSPAVPCQCMYLASGRSDEGCVAGCQNNRPSVGGDQEA
jgi:hypothetical protein